MQFNILGAVSCLPGVFFGWLADCTQPKNCLAHNLPRSSFFNTYIYSEHKEYSDPLEFLLFPVMKPPFKIKNQTFFPPHHSILSTLQGW